MLTVAVAALTLLIGLTFVDVWCGEVDYDSGTFKYSGKVEDAFIFIVVCCVVLLAIVTVCMVVFLIKYNRKRHPQPGACEREYPPGGRMDGHSHDPRHLHVLLRLGGLSSISATRPKDAMTVNVTARQWSWLFEYDNGKQSDVLNVPVGRPVKLIMTSVDVLHCLFIPAYRIKEDCVPGMKTHLWFTANEVGTYDIFCTEYCGVGHSHMRSKVVVMTSRAILRCGQMQHRGRTAADLGPRILQAKGASDAILWTAHRKSVPLSKTFGQEGDSDRSGAGKEHHRG